jgi:hypothetical protein
MHAFNMLRQATEMGKHLITFMTQFIFDFFMNTSDMSFQDSFCAGTVVTLGIKTVNVSDFSVNTFNMLFQVRQISCSIMTITTFKVFNVTVHVPNMTVETSIVAAN